MRLLWGRLVCRLRGHLRGRRVEVQENGKKKYFECPRCGRRTSYSIKTA